MANATAITINDLTPNGSIAAPTAQVLDTGTADVTLASPVTSEMDRIILEVTNTAAANLTVTIKAGIDPPAFRSVLGDVVSANIAQNGRRLFGPFESARFGQAGVLQVVFTPASGTITGSFLCYRLPKI